MAAVLAFAHLDGALFVFAYLEFIAPSEKTGGGSVAQDVIFFVAFMALAFPVCAWQSHRSYVRGIAWLTEDRRPSPVERDATLRLPARIVIATFMPWMAAALVFSFGSLGYEHTAHHVVKTGITVLLGGIVSCALAFMLLQRLFRPIFAIALAGEVPERASTLGVKPKLVLTWLLGSGIPLAGLALLPFAGHHATERTDIAGAVTALGAAGLFIGLLMTAIVAKSLADPLGNVRAALERVRDGDLSVTVAVDDGGEIGLLQSGVNRMVEGLRERQHLEDLFGKHVGSEVAERALAQGSGLDSEQREASALFVDIIGSTAMAEVLEPHEVVDRLNAFFGAVVRVVAAEGGWVNKFEGDGALCVFGAPAIQPDHAARALRAARSLHDELRSLAAAHPGLDAAIGVSSGSLVAGNVGTEQRYEYTVIGRPVNEAARLSELAKDRPTRVLAAAGALERAGDEAARWSALGTVGLRGQTSPTAIFEPIPVREPAHT
jgi:adenylate cyclase